MLVSVKPTRYLCHQPVGYLSPTRYAAYLPHFGLKVHLSGWVDQQILHLESQGRKKQRRPRMALVFRHSRPLNTHPTQPAAQSQRQMTTHGPHPVLGVEIDAYEADSRGLETILGANHTLCTPNHSAGTADSEGAFRRT